MSASTVEAKGPLPLPPVMRSVDAIDRAYKRAAERLERLVATARDSLCATGILVRSERPHTGADKPGEPYYAWSVGCERTVTSPAEVTRLGVTVEYREPMIEGDRPWVVVEWRAQIQRPGQIARRFERNGRGYLSLDDVERTGLEQVIAEAITRADRAVSSGARMSA